MLHPLLERQLDEVGIDPSLPADSDWSTLLDRVSQHYRESDAALEQAYASLKQANHALKVRAQADEAHQREHNLLRTLIDSMPAEVYIKDLDGRFVDANAETYLKLGGKSLNDLVGKNDYDFFTHDLAQSYRDAEVEIMRTGQPLINFEESIVDHRTDRQVWLLTTKVPLRNEHGEIIGLVGMGVDITERKRVEQALSAERTLLRTLIDSMPADVYIKDTQGRFLDVNAEVTHRLGGKTASDLIGKTDFDFFPEKVAREYDDAEKALFQTGEPIINFAEPVYDRRVGHDVWILTTKAPVRNEHGEITGLIGIGLDISERKRIEKELEEERTLLRTLIDAMPDYVYIKDPESRFIICNEATALSLGAKTSEDVIGRTDFSFHPAEIAARFYDEEQELFRTGKAMLNHEELVIDRRTGEWQYLLSTNLPLYASTGQIIGLVGVNRDITERKRADIALQESEERYRTVTELIADYAFSMRVEPSGAVIDEWSTDEAFTRFTGYRWDEVTDATMLYHPDDVAAVEAQVDTLMSGEAVDQESRIITKDGILRWMRIYRLPVWDKTQNRVVRYYGIAQDITEQKQVEEARRESERLRLALEKEKELGDLKTQLMVTISHEFRTPLSIAYTSAEMLERYYERMTLDQRENHLRQVETQIKQLIGMLEDISLLIYARFGQLTLNRELTDLKKLTETAISRLENFEEARQRIAVRIDEYLPSVMVDTRRVQYVLTNLLSNALKYSASTMKVSIDLLQHNSGVMIRVTDHGIGIAREEQARLFEPFYRANNVGEISGTGLGLSIVKEIVEMHNGLISLKSEVNQGTQVTVYLPGESEIT